MVSAVKEWMKRMDIHDTQYMIVRHFDADHPHVHLVFNLVDNFGKTIPMKKDYERSIEICKQLNLEYGFTGWQWDKKKDKNLDKLRNREWARENLRQTILSVLPGCRLWKSFESDLARVGVRMSFRYSKESRGTVGIVFSTDMFSCGGSKLDPQLRLLSLDRMFQHQLQSVCSQPSSSPSKCSQVDVSIYNDVPTTMPNDISHGQSFDSPKGLSAQWHEDFVSSGEESISVTLNMLCELILMPQVAYTPSVGGGGQSKGEWNDKKKHAKEKNNPNVSFKKRK